MNACSNFVPYNSVSEKCVHAKMNCENMNANTTRTDTSKLRNTKHREQNPRIPKGKNLDHYDSNPRSCFKWVPTGRVFKHVGYRWQPVKKQETPTTPQIAKFNPLGVHSLLSNYVEPLYQRIPSFLFFCFDLRWLNVSSINL
jgi:hypothetical protein